MIDERAAGGPVFDARPGGRPGPPGFHHVSLFVADVEASTRFYTEGLGLTLGRAFEDIAARGRPAARFGVASVFLDAGGGCYVELHPASGGPMAPPGSPLNHLAFLVDDVDAAYARAAAAGARPASIPLPGGPWDGSPLDAVMEGPDPEPFRMAFLLGPDGELIELCRAAPPRSTAAAT